MRYRSVLCMGGCVVDRIGETTEARERLHTSNIGRMRSGIGGVARNVAENLARLGVPVGLVSAVGEDADGRRAVAASRAAGIDTQGVVVMTGAATASYTAIFNGAGELVIGLADMAIFDAIAPSAAEAALAAASDDTLLFVDANLPAATLEAVARAKRGRMLAAVPVSRQKLARFAAILPDLDILFLNRYEAATLLGREGGEPATLAQGLAAGPVKKGLLTLGPDGALAWEEDRVTQIPALPSRPVNVNGAGDALAAGTLARLAAGDDFIAAASRAMAAAALTVEAMETVRRDLSMEAMLARFDLSLRTETISR
ncbi:PfkB family carbohydrate kinase [Labrys monachus]|uniref:Pseudouridine kinase n=1 Tax=Labrys monachus TaxID=217067 RepID=A0ABU0FK11_9HYPH|nr:PfkB family carbohydrate kinase [Labrys monachus]MDQ0394946.1 pseudouridine kinase [Labrys monachus]